MAKEVEAPAAEPVSDTTAAPAEAEAAPVEDEWASLSTSKKGKKAKKGKKQKADALVEPEAVQSPSTEAEVAVPEASGAAVEDSNSGPVGPDKNDAPVSFAAPGSKDTTDEKNAAPAAETDAVIVDKPSTSEEAVAEPATEKDAAASSSSGWFSWP